jgi:hypothetical protein
MHPEQSEVFSTIESSNYQQGCNKKYQQIEIKVQSDNAIGCQRQENHQKPNDAYLADLVDQFPIFFLILIHSKGNAESQEKQNAHKQWDKQKHTFPEKWRRPDTGKVFFHIFLFFFYKNIIAQNFMLSNENQNSQLFKKNIIPANNVFKVFSIETQSFRIPELFEQPNSRNACRD